MKVESTERGFEIVKFADYNGQPCSLQQSSAIDLEGGDAAGASFIWLGCDKNATPHLGYEMAPRMHLDRDQVILLVTHLQAWLETGRFADLKK
jgi:hypothetical protein